MYYWMPRLGGEKISDAQFAYLHLLFRKIQKKNVEFEQHQK